MIKKIGAILISVAIVTIGISAFNRLNYWERSIRIFNTGSEQSFRRDFDRGGQSDFENRENREGIERFARPETQNIGDSIVQRRFESFRGNRGSFQGNFERGGRGGRGDFRQRQNVQLKNVYRFLAVFALFTVGTIYIDKLIFYLRKRKKIKVPVN